MIWALIGILVAVEAAKLDKTYLPPPTSAKEAGGSDGALEVPLEPPYIDQYTPNEQEPQAWRPGTRSLKKGTKGTATPADTKFLENEDEIAVPALEKGRFISGSYSYTGPDNVLVTVTYKADGRKGRNEEEDVNDDEENAADEDDVDEEQVEADAASNNEEEEQDDDLIVPTPPSLPAELARAFDFHKSKHLGQEEKTVRTKKPIRKNHRNKGDKHGAHGVHGGHNAGGHNYGTGNYASNNYEGQYGQKLPGHIHGHKQGTSGISGPAYQYPPPPPSSNQYGTPTIHQGYSYPKAS